MGAFSFGSYYPGTSPLHRMDPRAKLLLGFVFIIATLFVRSWAGLGITAAFVLACYLASRVPAGRAWRSLALLLGITLVVSVLKLFSDHSGATLVQLGPLAISQGSLHNAAFTAVRLTLMMAGMSLVTLTTTTLNLTAGFERLMSPFARIGLPAHELGMMLGIALRFMPQFAIEMQRTYQAQVSRGAKVQNGAFGGVRMLASVAVPLFASVFRHAETLSAAMDARCYHGEQGRTRLHPLAFSPTDAAAVAAVAAYVLLIALVH